MLPTYADYYGNDLKPHYKAPPLTYNARNPSQGYRDYITQSHQDMMSNGGYDSERMRSITQRAASVYGGMRGRQTNSQAPYQPFQAGIDPSYTAWMNRYGKRRRPGLRSQTAMDYAYEYPSMTPSAGAPPSYGAPAPQYSGGMPDYGFYPVKTT